MSLGERFRSAREQRGLTLSDVAEHLHIRSVYLAAIEEENWKAIGAAVYVRGFLRTYARYLGINPEEAVATFNADEAAGAVAPSPGPIARHAVEYGRQGGPMTPLIWVASIVALALIGFVIYLYVTPARMPAQVAVAGGQPTAPSLGNGSGTAIPATAMPASLPGSAPAAPKTLVIHLTAPSWLRVSVDGNVSIEGTFPAGTTKTFHGNVALVRVGNAGGVQLTVDGKALGRLGHSGDVVEKSFVL